MLAYRWTPCVSRLFRTGTGAAITLLIVVLTAGIASQVFAKPDFSAVPADGFAFVEERPFEVLISQSGPLDSSKNVKLINQCEWTTYVISMVPQGTWVEAGDVIMELDSTDLRELAQKHEVLLVQADAALKDAEEDLHIQELTNESRLADAELQARLASLQLDGYRKAQLPQQLHELNSAVALAEEELSRSEKKLQFVTNMVSLGYRTNSDREAERLAVMKARQSLTLAQDRLQVLRDFTSVRTLAQYEALAVETQRELERVQLAGSAALLSRKVRLESRRRTYEIHKAYLQRLRRNIAACTIRAPRAGEVVLGTESSSTRTPLSEGSRTRYLQTLASIPDRERMQVNLRIHESRIRLLEEGQSADIRVDALSDRTFQGRIASVSTVPVSGQFPNYDLREYRVVVELTGDQQELKQLAPGMTAHVAVHTARKSQAVLTPLSSVVQIAGKNYAFVRDQTDVRLQDVTVGLSNDQSIEVLGGLQAGDEVVARPRVTCAERLLQLEQTMLAENENLAWAGEFSL